MCHVSIETTTTSSPNVTRVKRQLVTAVDSTQSCRYNLPINGKQRSNNKMALIDPLHGSYAYAMPDPKTPSLALNHVFSSSNPPKPANLFLYSYTKTTVKVEGKGLKKKGCE